MKPESQTTISPFRSVAGSLRHAALWAYELIDALGRCWLLLLALLGVGLLLAVVPQGREALWAAGAAGHRWQVPMFFATSLAGAVLVTLFASQILDQGSRPGDEGVSAARGHACFTAPGLLGLLAAFLVPLLIEHLVSGNPLLLPQRRHELRRLGILFQAMALPAVVVARCPKVVISVLFPWRSGRRQQFGTVGLLAVFILGLSLSSYPFTAGTLVLFAGLVILDGLWWRVGMEPAMNRWRRWAGLVMAIGWLAAGVWVTARPEVRAPMIGPATLVLFAKYFWLAVAYLVFLALGRRLTDGVATALLIGLTLLFLTGPFNLRSVRTIAPAAHEKAPGSVTLSEHLDRWLEERRSQIEGAPAPYPVFIASAEGGGIRAAFWTAGILTALQDASPAFADHLLGISGVSGGSLGAATFVALVREAQLDRLGGRGAPGGESIPLQAYADEALGHDFLSPVLATMLIPDVASCLLHNEWAGDRASVLEQSFENGWRDSVHTGTFADPLAALWDDRSGPRVPGLFLNSTEADTGRRIVNSHVVLDPGLSPAISLPGAIAADSLRVSTAVLLSARFPAISPIGSLGLGPGAAPMRIVDGGYVDNSGTLTASEVVQALDRSATRLGLRGRIRVVAIVITDDPISPEGPRSDPARPAPGIEGTAAGALLSPFETLDNVRQALSRKHREAFRALILGAGGEVLDGFALRASPIEFPLGWMLSAATRDALREQIRGMRADPRSHFIRVATLLAPEEAGRP